MSKRFEPVWFGLESIGGQFRYGYRDVFLDCPPTIVGEHWDTVNARADADACANTLNAVYEASKRGEQLEARIEYAPNVSGHNGKVMIIESWEAAKLHLIGTQTGEEIDLPINTVTLTGRKRETPPKAAPDNPPQSQTTQHIDSGTYLGADRE